MVASTLVPLEPALSEQRIQLSGISWQTYEGLLAELATHRRLRLTYHCGYLEIMAPSPEHERCKKVMGRLVETLAEELGVQIEPLGSTTFKRPNVSGAEPDECFYLRNIEIVRGKKRLSPDDPAPDLVLEIDVTSSSERRFQIYADLGVSEVWLYDGRAFSIKQLRDGEYVVCDRSQFFPQLPLLEIVRFLHQAGTVDYLELVKEFRHWVRHQLQDMGP